MRQPRIAALENPDTGGINLATLVRIAKAFDVGLVVRFAPFSELIDWEVGITAERLTPESFVEEQQSVDRSMAADAQIWTTPFALQSEEKTTLP